MSFNNTHQQYTLYRVHTLIPGYKLGMKGREKYIAVPTKYLRGPVLVTYAVKEKMYIGDGVRPVLENTFEDKHRPGEKYTLSYFKWEPDTVQTSFMPEDPEGTDD